MYNSIEDVKRIRSLQSAQVRGHAGVLNNYYGNHRMNKSRKELTTISVSRENYLSLKKLGCAGEYFNDVLTEILKKISLP